MKSHHHFGKSSLVSLILLPFMVALFVACSGKAELVKNKGFDKDTSGWRGVYSTISSVGGGQSGNCLEIKRTDYVSQWAYQVGIPLTVGKKYRLSAYVKSGTSGNEPFGLSLESDKSGPKTLISINGTSSGAWVQHSGVFEASLATCNVYLYKQSSTPGTMLFDTVTLEEVE